MTLIAGFVGRGGSVLCSDGLEVQGGYAKRLVDKISLSGDAMTGESLRFQFAIGCSGSGTYMDMLQAELVRELESLSTDKQIELAELPDIICRALSEPLVNFYGRHIWPRPSGAANAEMQFLLLIQPCPFGESCLIKIAETAVNIISDSYACIGIGSYLAEYILENIFSGSGEKEYQLAVAAYVLTEVNKNVDGCGHGYAIYHLDENGKLSTMFDMYRPEDFSEIKRIFEWAFQTMTDISPESIHGFTPRRLAELIEEQRLLRIRRLEKEMAFRARLAKQSSDKTLES
jgi:20S proteasome alpha/beta subunit